MTNTYNHSKVRVRRCRYVLDVELVRIFADLAYLNWTILIAFLVKIFSEGPKNVPQSFVTGKLERHVFPVSYHTKHVCRGEWTKEGRREWAERNRRTYTHFF